MQQYIMFAAIFVVFYFFMIRPQYKKQKDQKNFLAKLKKGDELVTIGGIHGTVYEIKDGVVILEIDTKGSKITISKEAISYTPMTASVASKPTVSK